MTRLTLAQMIGEILATENFKDGKKKGTLSSDELCELEDKLDKLQAEE